MASEVGTSPLHEYVKQNPGYVRVYESYEANLGLIEEIRAAMPAARLVTVCEYWCGDCRRLVPRMARIADFLPGWEFEMHPWDGERRNKPWQIRAIPTFILFLGDTEIGRIVENPQFGAIEQDLQAIISKATQGNA